MPDSLPPEDDEPQNNGVPTVPPPSGWPWWVWALLGVGGVGALGLTYWAVKK